MWRSASRTPLYYPDAVTLRPDATADFLAEIDTSPGCSVKDSFGTVDLSSHGFVELFTARWIHLEAGQRVTSGLRAERVSTAAELSDWQDAWHGGDGAPDVFRPKLLDDANVLVLGLYEGRELAGGAVLNRGSGVVGLSNLFTVGGRDAAEVWSAAVAASRAWCPGLPVVGYERGSGLEHAIACGFRVLGPLRVWLRQ
ncbi:hypothetical protein [Lentzea sp. NPDC051838]|uniref:hypothetical protein n=1 Tax=Lentzea sp. NPDC051838 TaxID=3154849 RepID=UPI003426F850